MADGHVHDEYDDARVRAAEAADRLDHKRVIKEAIGEWMMENPTINTSLIESAINAWLDKQYQRVGKWTVGGIIAMFIAAFLLFVAIKTGKGS